MEKRINCKGQDGTIEGSRICYSCPQNETCYKLPSQIENQLKEIEKYILKEAKK